MFARAANAAESNFVGCEIVFTNASTIFFIFYLEFSILVPVIRSNECLDIFTYTKIERSWDEARILNDIKHSLWRNARIKIRPNQSVRSWCASSWFLWTLKNNWFEYLVLYLTSRTFISVVMREKICSQRQQLQLNQIKLIKIGQDTCTLYTMWFHNPHVQDHTNVLWYKRQLFVFEYNLFLSAFLSHIE